MLRLAVEFVLVVVVCVAGTLAAVKTLEVNALRAELSAANGKLRNFKDKAPPGAAGHQDGKPGAGAHAVHWGYEGEMGPARWGEAYPLCGTGKAQSPIDIRGPFDKDERVLKPGYRPGTLRVVNNGHTLQVNVAPGSTMAINGETYELLQFHFHRPSEERVDGRASAMVAHLVHRGAGGKLAVVGVLLNEGKEHPLIATVWAAAPRVQGPEVVLPGTSVDPSLLLPPSLEFFSYEGSLTTPPCTEGVTFFILKTPVTIGATQIDAFPFKANARPVQPLNGRKVAAN